MRITSILKPNERVARPRDRNANSVYTASGISVLALMNERRAGKQRDPAYLPLSPYFSLTRNRFASRRTNSTSINGSALMSCQRTKPAASITNVPCSGCFSKSSYAR